MAGPLRFAVLEITNRCNLRCPHCASTSGRARENELSFEEWAALLGEIKRLGGEEVTVIGGEALMRPDWFDICEQVRRLDMRLILITNGIRADVDDTPAQFRALRPHLIGISIDGASKDTYRRHRGVDRFDHVMALLRRLRDDGHENVNAITTFMRSNIREFDRFADLFENTGITWQVQLAGKGGRRFDDAFFLTPDDYAFFVERMTHAYRHRPGLRLRHMDDFGYCPIDPTLRFLHQTWKGCIAGRELIGVRSDGRIMGCLSLGDGFEVADLRTRSLDSIWHSDDCFEPFRNKEKYLSGDCLGCPAGAECRAGCTSIAMSATGEIGNNPYCIRLMESKRIVDGIFN